MKFSKTIVATALILSAPAYALPATVSQEYYEHLPHRMSVWLDNPGFCVASKMKLSPVCLSDM